MRFGTWRGVTLTIALIIAGTLTPTPACAGLFGLYDPWHTIPRETLAMDYRTGGVMLAPPIPYGEYAKDYVGCLTAPFTRLCGLCRGVGCRLCGWLGKGKGCGHCFGKGCGHCHGSGLAGPLCGDCGGLGCPKCLGHGPGGGLLHSRGLFHHKEKAYAACAGGPCGHDHGPVVAGGAVVPSQQQPVKVVVPSAQCQTCGGKGCGLCGKGGKGLLGARACRQCRGKGCGLCGGTGCAPYDPCAQCGGKGCGLCGKGKGHGCKHCGGLGCGLCGWGHALLGKVFHAGYVKYFVGPGGPVPLTPGYVNYIVPTRSPRDYFAFPPFVDIDP
ncbi:MAG: hypothetical protein IRY99_22645 [Isosphaeraceae bacterium]|nr:hypothetical protein [Isosphaeraceae bacterium]